jgi:site-specific DNA-methyltransferase (adenine-specific)
MYLIARADAARIPLPSKSVDLVIGSPPYADCRSYLEDGKDLGISRGAVAWVEWMLRITAEALRVSKGAVIWVAAGKTDDRTYLPYVEGLAWRWFVEGWTDAGPGTTPAGSSYRPVYWHRSGIPGSGGDQWFRADVEYCLAFKRPGRLLYADNAANGEPPKWEPGGKMTNRMKNGKRCYERNWKPNTVVHTNQHYTLPDIANPGNLLRVSVGGGKLGHSFAHENDAPYPVDVPAWFIASHSPPGGLILDPFDGSGTTVHAAIEQGRRGIGLDLRQSQCRLARRRLRTVTPGFAFRAGAPHPIASDRSLEPAQPVEAQPSQLPLF